MFIWSRGRLLSAVAALPLACAGPVAPPGAVADASFADASFADASFAEASFADASFAEVATTDAVTPPDDGAQRGSGSVAAWPGGDATTREARARSLRVRGVLATPGGLLDRAPEVLDGRNLLEYLSPRDARPRRR